MLRYAAALIIQEGIRDKRLNLLILRKKPYWSLKYRDSIVIYQATSLRNRKKVTWREDWEKFQRRRYWGWNAFRYGSTSPSNKSQILIFCIVIECIKLFNYNKDSKTSAIRTYVKKMEARELFV